MKYLYIFAVIALLISFIKDRKKTLAGVKGGIKKFNKILPTYLILLMIISIVLLVSDKFIINYLSSDNNLIGMVLSILIGSITMMPGFIAYPLSGILLEKGVPYITIGGFVTSLMLVGVVTFPLEISYFGKKFTIIRNIFAVLISIGIALGIGIFYGEIL